MLSKDLKVVFKKYGIKNTVQRQAVYNFLSSGSAPITAEHIYMELTKTESEAMNLSTVYRILDLFTRKGLVLKSNLQADGKSTYEMNHMEHRHHLVCVKCNSIVPIKGCPLSDYEKRLSESTHYKILEHHLEILGICPKCQE
jgi:Fur family ferric uptake transcriptional regulator